MQGWARGVAMAVGLCSRRRAPSAQTYPSRPITIVVPASPGGVTDMLGRILAKRITEKWGQQGIVENKPGANNQIAAEYVAKAAPDGYTLFVGPETTFVVNPSIYPRLNYDPIKDFTPITGLITINQALLVNPSLPVNNVKELLALAKSNQASSTTARSASARAAISTWSCSRARRRSSSRRCTTRARRRR